MTRKKFSFMLPLVLLVSIPAAVTGWFLSVIRTYDDLLEKHECNQSICEADFDGDGLMGILSIERADPEPEFDSWFVVTDSGKELLKIPRRSIDNSLRTHAALVDDKGRTRLIIYDHIQDRKGPRTLVLSYDGRIMSEVSASEKDNHILAAIRARDDTGTQLAWAIFQMAVWPVLLVYYLVLCLVTWQIGRKRFNRDHVRTSLRHTD